MGSDERTGSLVKWPQEVEERAFAAINIIEVAAACIFVILTGLAWTYVLRHKHRGVGLLVVRGALAFMLVTWVAGVLVAHEALWDVLGAIITLTDDTKELLCYITTPTVFGLIEPMVLMLIAGLIRMRAASASVRFGWTVVAWATIIALPFAVVQATLLTVGVLVSWQATVLGPRPLEEEDDEMVVVSGTDEKAPWWRKEGCAVSIAAVSVQSLFVIPFIVFWILLCLRLSRILLNMKIRRRLTCVQVIYTLAPLSLLLLRTSRLIFPASFEVTRRLVKDVEFAIVLVACVVCLHSLIWRPVNEGPKLRQRLSESEAMHSSRYSSQNQGVVLTNGEVAAAGAVVGGVAGGVAGAVASPSGVQLTEANAESSANAGLRDWYTGNALSDLTEAPSASVGSDRGDAAHPVAPAVLQEDIEEETPQSAPAEAPSAAAASDIDADEHDALLGSHSDSCVLRASASSGGAADDGVRPEHSTRSTDQVTVTVHTGTNEAPVL